MRAAALVLLIPVLSGCFAARYLTQATAGQYDLLHRAVPISQVLADERVPFRTRFLLSSVQRLKEFARAQGLAATRSYRRYTPLDRASAVWVVQGSAPLSFDLRRWWFPIVGSVPYLGFFDQQAARAYAAQLGHEQPLDVSVRGAAAYSTLGWFSDPVLSTMLSDTDVALGELAEVVLHESTHATLFIPDQTAFDESLASFVGERLSVVWLAQAIGLNARETVAWREAGLRTEARAARLHAAWVELDALYRSSRGDDEKRREKARIFEALRRELRLEVPLNNASLAGYRTYATGTQAFDRLLHACLDSWPRTLTALRTLRGSDFSTPQQERFDELIDALAHRACP